ncbi:hypothetical protein PMIN02_004553 [Paraphaeosphaeria minitans]|uniref:Uncharacterized protein n=1 Tax=Paraphaeosphaeria minitans TaxID=565426 RepID=A0A9P6KUX4_9PLEO|nr:hypothetical protein PMIN01_02998 [Paraphaeosphaeria minitans]
MRHTAAFAVAATSISVVAALAVPRPWIHDDVQSYHRLPSRDGYPSSVAAATNDLKPTQADAKKTLYLSIRDFDPWEITEAKSQQLHSSTGTSGGSHDHNAYLPPSPAPHTQEKIDITAHDTSTDDSKNLKSILADAETRLQLFYRSVGPAEGGDENKHHLPFHEDYLEKPVRTYRLHSHDEYLEGSGSDAAKGPGYTPAGTKEETEEKVQRRCVWGKRCKDICAQGGVGNLIGCIWNCGGDANMPTCSE